MASKILLKVKHQPLLKIELPVTKEEMHMALDMILENQYLSHAFGDLMMQVLWMIRTRKPAEQVFRANAIGQYLDTLAAGKAGAQ